MKIPIELPHPRRGQQGSAVILFLGLLSIMLICVSVNAISVRSLERELKRLEKKQVQRLQPAKTVSPAATQP